MIQVAWDCLHLISFSSRHHISKMQVNGFFFKKTPSYSMLHKNQVILQYGCFFYSQDSLIHFIIVHRRFICLPFVLDPYYQGKFWHMVYAHRALWFNSEVFQRFWRSEGLLLLFWDQSMRNKEAQTSICIGLKNVFWGPLQPCANSLQRVTWSCHFSGSLSDRRDL